MTKNELIERIAMRADLSKAKAALALEAMIKEVETALRKGDSVKLPGFGTFSVTTVKARRYINPQDGTPVEVPEHRNPKFRVGQTLKDAVK